MISKQVSPKVTDSQVKSKSRLILGRVVSSAGQKTVVVAVTRSFVHSRLGKVIRRVKKYSVHDELGRAREGDVVRIFEGRPVSKTKYMYLKDVVESVSVV